MPSPRLSLPLLLGLLLFGLSTPALGQAVAFVESPEAGNGNVHFVDRDGTVTDTGVSILGGPNDNDGYLGRVIDFNRDGVLDVVAVDGGTGNLLLISKDGSTETILGEGQVAIDGDSSDPPPSMGLGDQDEDGAVEILFQNDGDSDQIYRIEYGGSPEVVQGGLAADAVIGYGDFNGDGSGNLVYVGENSDQIDYCVGTDCTPTAGSGISKNKGAAVGPLIDLDRDGTPRVLFINGSQNPALLASDGGKEVLATNVGNATKGPMGAVNRRGNRKYEAVFQENGILKTVTANGTVAPMKDASGNVIDGVDDAAIVAGSFAAGDDANTEIAIDGKSGNEGDAGANPSTIGGDAGWRMIGPPVQGQAPVDLFALGDPAGSVIEFGSLNSGSMFYEWDDQAGGFSAITGADSTSSSALQSGRGYILFLFDDAGTANADPLDPALTLDVVGQDVPTQSVTVDGLNTGASFHLLANPYNQAFSLKGGLRGGGGGSVAAGGTNYRTTIQIWNGGDSSGEGNAVAGSYCTFDLSSASDGQRIDGGYASDCSGGEVISAWQAFFLERKNDGTSQTRAKFKQNGRTTSPRDVVGERSTTGSGPHHVHLGLGMTVENSSGTEIARDEAASLYFHPNATTGDDAFDASKLTPLTSRYAVIGPVGPTGEGTAIKAQESRPLNAELPLEVPLRLKTEGDISGTAHLRAARWEGVPSDWTVTLVDTKGTSDPGDDEEYELTASDTTGYAFQISSSSTQTRTAASTSSLPREESDAPTLPEQLSLTDRELNHTETPMTRHAQQTAADTTRFTLRVEGSPLPVELATLNATLEDEEATLRWTTASETNNAGFEVQHRGPDAEAFEPLGFVESKAPNGTADTATEYRFGTTTLEVGRHAFRLRQVDTDGSATLSDTVAVEVGLDAASTVEVAPNPVQTDATITLRVQTAQEVNTALYDLLGRKVRTLHEARLAPRQAHRLTLEADGLPSGAYLLRVTGERFETTRRVTIVQ